MKARKYLMWRIVQACFALILMSSSIMGCYDNDDDDATNDKPYTISGDASGSQMVPAVTGTGSGTISGTYNPTTRQLTYTSNWIGLTGSPNAGGFFNGAAGSTGTAIGPPWTFEPGITVTGSRTGTMTLTTEQASQLTAGTWYYSYGTIANPNGEIRGQITATR